MSEGQITGSILVSSDAKNTDTNQGISKSGIIIKKDLIEICKPWFKHGAQMSR